MSFSVRIRVRGYEVDALGHLNAAVYLQYGEHARWEFLQAAGVHPQDLLAAGIGPVVLKTTIRNKRELRTGDDVEVSCAFEAGNGRFLQLAQRFRLPAPDGTAVATLDATIGLLDLETRRLLPDPLAHLRKLATSPEVLGLSA